MVGAWQRINNWQEGYICRSRWHVLLGASIWRTRKQEDNDLRQKRENLHSQTANMLPHRKTYKDSKRNVSYTICLSNYMICNQFVNCFLLGLSKRIDFYNAASSCSCSMYCCVCFVRHLIVWTLIVTSRDFNPLGPHDAFNHHFTSLKTDLIFLQPRVLEQKFPWNWFTNTW